MNETNTFWSNTATTSSVPTINEILEVVRAFRRTPEREFISNGMVHGVLEAGGNSIRLSREWYDELHKLHDHESASASDLVIAMPSVCDLRAVKDGDLPISFYGIQMIIDDDLPRVADVSPAHLLSRGSVYIQWKQ